MAAAALDPEAVADEAACCVCLDVVGIPLTTHCGHTICKECHEKLKAGRDPLCPKCRQEREPAGFTMKTNFAMQRVWTMLRRQIEAAADSSSSSSRKRGSYASGATTDVHVRSIGAPVAFKKQVTDNELGPIAEWQRGVVVRVHADSTLTIKSGTTSVKRPVDLTYPFSYADTGDPAWRNGIDQKPPPTPIPANGIYPGALVLVKAKRTGNWLSAHVVREGGGRVYVNLHLAETTVAVRASKVRPQLQQGLAVEGYTKARGATSASWVGGKITAVHPNGTYNVEFENADAMLRCTPDKVRRRRVDAGISRNQVRPPTNTGCSA